MEKTSLVTKLISIGIDPGTRNGAIAIVDDNMKILYLAKAPYYSVDVKSKKVKSKLNKETGKYETTYRQRTWTDFKAMREIFLPYVKKDILYTIEKIHAMTGEKESSSFVFGNSLGIFQGLHALLDPIEFYEPTPQEWKKELGLGSNKSLSKDLAEEIYEVDLKDYLKKGKTDDVAEALLLAFYGLRQHYLKEGEK